MQGISLKIATHQLRVDPASYSVCQKKMRFSRDRQMAITQEVNKLLATSFIRDVLYPTWLVNVVMVKKSNGKWRMCVDFINLNKAYLKDSCPLPRIDRLVDFTAGFEFLSSLNAYSRYHQISMHPDDEEKIPFITESNTYSYKAMPFRLKNARVTYQRTVN